MNIYGVLHEIILSKLNGIRDIIKLTFKIFITWRFYRMLNFCDYK